MGDFIKRLRRSVAAIAIIVLTTFPGQMTAASALTWNSATSGPPEDGTGTWSTNSNWWNNSADVSWSNADGDTAVFGAATGSSTYTVTLTGSQSVGGLTFQSQAYSIAGGGTLVLVGSATPIAVNASGGTIETAIAGSGGMVKTGSGALMLTTANVYSGATTINNGTLQLNTGNSGSGALASSTITVNSDGLLALNAPDVLGYTSGREALIISGGTVSNITSGSRVTLQNTVNMMGGLLTGSGSGDGFGVFSVDTTAGFNATSDAFGNPATINAQTISIQKGNTFFNVIRGQLAPASDLTINSAIVPYNGGNYGIIETGNGILTLTDSNTYTGGTTITGGTLVIGSGGASGSLSTSPNSLNIIVDNGTLAFCRSNTVVQGADFSGLAVSGSGGLVQQGSGALSLGPSNSYSGATTVAGGTLSATVLANGGQASSIGASGNASSELVLNGGVLQYAGSSVSIGRGFTVGAGGGGISVAGGTQLGFGNSLSVAGTVTKTGPGTLLLTSYSGSTVSPGGMFVVGQGTLGFGGSYYNSSPFGYHALNIDVEAGGDLDIASPHALGGGTPDVNTSWGVVSVLGGTMTLAAEQYVSGGTVNSLGRLVLQAGTIANGGTGELRAAADTSWISTLAAAQPSTINVPLLVQSGPFMFDVAAGSAAPDLLISGEITGGIAGLGGAYGITKLGAGNLTLTGSNNYTTTRIAGGTLQIGAGGNSGTPGDGLVTDNAVLAFSRSDLFAVTNVISGSGSVAQLGPGTLVLSGTNGYTGGTTVAGGTLILTSNEAVPDGTSLTVGDAANFAAPVVPAGNVAQPLANAAVPEPATFVLLANALWIMLLCSRAGISVSPQRLLCRGPGDGFDRDRAQRRAVVQIDILHRVVRVVIALAVDVVVLHEEHDRHAGVGKNLAVRVVERAAAIVGRADLAA